MMHKILVVISVLADKRNIVLAVLLLLTKTKSILKNTLDLKKLSLILFQLDANATILIFI